jgi:hypothetical protein
LVEKWEASNTPTIRRLIISRVQIPGEKSVGKRASCLCVLPSCRQPKGADVHQPDHPAVDVSSSQRQGPPGTGQDVQPVHSRLELAYEGSHRSACRGHDHRFTSLGLGSLRPEAPAPVLRVRGGQFFSCGSPAAERRTSDQRGALRQGPKCVGFTTDKGVRVLPLD